MLKVLMGEAPLIMLDLVVAQLDKMVDKVVIQVTLVFLVDKVVLKLLEVHMELEITTKGVQDLLYKVVMVVT